MEAGLARPGLAKVASQRSRPMRRAWGNRETRAEPACHQDPAGAQPLKAAPPRPPAPRSLPRLFPLHIHKENPRLVVENSGHGAEDLGLQASSAPKPPMRLRKVKTKVRLESTHKRRSAPAGHLPPIVHHACKLTGVCKATWSVRPCSQGPCPFLSDGPPPQTQSCTHSAWHPEYW